MGKQGKQWQTLFSWCDTWISTVMYLFLLWIEPHLATDGVHRVPPKPRASNLTAVQWTTCENKHCWRTKSSYFFTPEQPICGYKLSMKSTSSHLLPWRICNQQNEWPHTVTNLVTKNNLSPKQWMREKVPSNLLNLTLTAEFCQMPLREFKTSAQ